MNESETQVREALNAAGMAVGHWGTAEKAVLAFLDHMREHYVGDMEAERSTAWLSACVRDLVR